MSLIGPTLYQIIGERVGLWAFCTYCGHSGRVNPRHLAMTVKDGSDPLLEELQMKLKCRKCRTHHSTFVVDPFTIQPQR